MSVRSHTEKIGRTLADLRQSRGWTLRDLSQATGVSVPVLSKVENNQTGISFETVMKILNSLAMTFDELVGGANEEPGPRGAARRVINPAGSGIKVASLGRDYEFFASDLRRKNMVPMITTVHAHLLEEWGEYSRHEGDEWMYVLSGTIVLHTEFYAPVTLAKGDSIYIDSGMGHAMTVLGDGSAEMLSVYAGPAGAPPTVPVR